MDRKARNLLILCGVLAILIIGYAAVALLVPDEPDTAPETDTPAVTLFRVTSDGLQSLTVETTRDGAPVTMSFARDTDWYWREDKTVPLGTAGFEACAEALTAATGTLLATNVTAAERKSYGLDAPAMEITFTDAAGGEQSFSLGAYNAYNGTYCAIVNGDVHTVYMVEATLFETFDFSVTDLVYIDDLPACKSEKLVSVTFTTGESTITTTHETVEVDGMEALAWFRSVDGSEPIRVSDTIAERIDTLLGDMDYLSCLSVSRADFPTYGLDKGTTTMTVVYEKTVGGVLIEETFTLTLGTTDSYDYYYVNPANTPVTMLLGGNVWHKLITYDDTAISTEGVSDETAAPTT